MESLQNQHERHRGLLRESTEEAKTSCVLLER